MASNAPATGGGKKGGGQRHAGQKSNSDEGKNHVEKSESAPAAPADGETVQNAPVAVVDAATTDQGAELSAAPVAGAPAPEPEPEPEAEPAVSTPAEEDAGAASDRAAEEAFSTQHKGRGIIKYEENGLRKALVPRNAAWLLDTIRKVNEHPSEGKYAGQPDVYIINKNIPGLAFQEPSGKPKRSAKTLAQSVKKSLDEKGVIEILEPGNPGKGSVIRLLVDEYEQKPGKQGVSEASPSRAPRKTRTRRTTNEEQQLPANRPPATPARREITFKTFAEFEQMHERVLKVKHDFPDVYQLLTGSAA